MSILLEAFLEGLNEGGQQGHPKVVRQTPQAHSLQEQRPTVQLVSISQDLECAVNPCSCFPCKRHTLLIYETCLPKTQGYSPLAAKAGSAWCAWSPPAHRVGFFFIRAGFYKEEQKGQDLIQSPQPC